MSWKKKWSCWRRWRPKGTVQPSIINSFINHQFTKWNWLDWLKEIDGIEVLLFHWWLNEEINCFWLAFFGWVIGWLASQWLRRKEANQAKKSNWWNHEINSSANWIYEICGLWALAPLCRERTPFQSSWASLPFHLSCPFFVELKREDQLRK